MPFYGILANIGILLIGALVPLALTMRQFVDRRLVGYKVVLGLAFGLIAVALAETPINFADGYVVDVRAAPLILVGAVGSVTAASIAVGVAVLALLSDGVPLNYGPVIGAVLFGLLGSLMYYALDWRVRRSLRRRDLPWLILATGAAVVAVGPLQDPEGATFAWRIVQAAANGAAVALLGGAYAAVDRVRRRGRDAEHSMAQARIALQATGAGMWYYRPDEEIIELDDLSAGILARQPGTQQLTRDEFAAILIQEDRARILGTLDAAFVKGNWLSARCRATTGDGNVVHLEISAQPTTTGRGSMVGTVRDVTAEEEQLTRVRLNNLALDKAANGVVICRADGDMPIVYVNDAFTAITGYGASEVMGRNCRFLHDREPDQEEIQIIRDAFAKGTSCVAELRNFRKDGTPFWNRIKISPIRNLDGVLTHYVGIQLDITHQREMEAAVERHKDRLESILSSAPDAIVTVDERMIINEFNSAAERLFGWSRADIIGRPLNILVPTSHAPRHDELAERFMTMGETGARVMADWRNIQGMRADGTTFPVLVTLSRFLVNGRPAVTAIARDMSSVANMNRELFEMSTQLSRQLQEVQAANEAKSRFLASMSHELRTPLNAIIGFSQAMRECYFGPIENEKYAEYVKDINVSAMHLLSLINDLLDLTAIENGRLSLNVERIAVGAIIDGASTAVTAMLNEKALHLAVHDGSAEWEIFADRRALHQCLLNLLSNAIKFTPVGGSITIRAAVDEDGTLTIAVRDSGIGIPADRLGKLGVPFEQIGNPMLAETKGTGLGLAITKRLVEGMSGSLRVESELDRGTVVHLRFPGAVKADTPAGGSDVAAG